MKRAYLPPLAVLAAIVLISLWNIRVIEHKTAQLQIPLQYADALARMENWAAAEAALAESYQDWTGCQTYLHIVTHHDTVDTAEALYRRTQAFAQEQDLAEFRAALSDLIAQLQLLAEAERGNANNIL